MTARSPAARSATSTTCSWPCSSIAPVTSTDADARRRRSSVGQREGEHRGHRRTRRALPPDEVADAADHDGGGVGERHRQRAGRGDGHRGQLDAQHLGADHVVHERRRTGTPSRRAGRRWRATAARAAGRPPGWCPSPGRSAGCRWCRSPARWSRPRRGRRRRSTTATAGYRTGAASDPGGRARWRRRCSPRPRVEGGRLLPAAERVARSR